jgi:hypothetical protein
MSDNLITSLRQYAEWANGTDQSGTHDAIMAAVDEIERLREAIRRLAAQEATLSVQGGNVTVTVDATLTDEEREAIQLAAEVVDDEYYGTNCKKELAAAATLRSLLERLHT